MNEYRYYVEKQSNTTLVTKRMSTYPVEMLHLVNDTVTFVCTNFFDAIELAEALIEGELSKVEKEYKGLLLFVERVEGFNIHVNRTQIKCSEASNPCCAEWDINFLG